MDSTVDVDLESFPDRAAAEQLLVPIAEKELNRWRPEADEFRPSLSSLEVVELLEPHSP